MKSQQLHRVHNAAARSTPRDAKHSFRTLALLVVIGSFVLSSAIIVMVLADGSSSFYMQNFCDIRWVGTEQLSGGEDWYCSYRYGKVFLYVVLYSTILAIPILAIMYALLLTIRFCQFVVGDRKSEQPPR